MINYNDYSKTNDITIEGDVIVNDETVTSDEGPMMGKVNTPLLNVRAQPFGDASLVCDPIKQGTELTIDLDESTDGWLHIYLSSGIDGYVMEKFIEY